MKLNYIEIPVKPEQIAEANRIRKEFPIDGLNNSITDGESQEHGILAELVVFDYLKGKGFNIEYISTSVGEEKYHYDFKVDFGDGNIITYDLKTKVSTQNKVYEYWDCSVASYNTTQQCNRYLFARITEDKTKVFLLGSIDKEEFYESKGRFNKEGEIDPNKPTWTYKADCFNINIKELDAIRV